MRAKDRAGKGLGRAGQRQARGPRASEIFRNLTAGEIPNGIAHVSL